MIMQANIQVQRCDRCPEELDEVRDFLQDILNIAETTGANSFVLKIHILQALVAWMRGDKEEALKYLRQAIVLAEPEGYVRAFLNPGPRIGDLLEYACSQGVSPSFTKGLMDAFSKEPSLEGRSVTVLDMPYSERLSERELEVLRLLNSDLSTPDIANELIVAVSTVRSHVKSIYSKLNVHSRLEAIDRAKDLNLL
jgi:LuxR family maltose regulon positive regulatory protein